MKSHTVETVVYVRGADSDRINEHLRNCLQFCNQSLEYQWIDERHVRRALTDTYRTGTGADRGTILTTRRRSEGTGIRVERDWSRQQQQYGRRRTKDVIQYLNTDMHRTVNVVTPTVEAVARNRKHIGEILEILEAGNVMHVVEDGFTLNAATEQVENILELATGLYSAHERPDTDTRSRLDEDVELEFADPDAPADAVQTGAADQTDDGTATAIGIELPVRKEYKGGRPPKGFDIEDGELVSNEHYVTINTVIQRFRDGDISKTEAADKLDVARSTIDNLSSRAELYQLA